MLSTVYIRCQASQPANWAWYYSLHKYIEYNVDTRIASENSYAKRREFPLFFIWQWQANLLYLQLLLFFPSNTSLVGFVFSSTAFVFVVFLFLLHSLTRSSQVHLQSADYRKNDKMKAQDMSYVFENETDTRVCFFVSTFAHSRVLFVCSIDWCWSGSSWLLFQSSWSPPPCDLEHLHRIGTTCTIHRRCYLDMWSMIGDWLSKCIYY